MPRDELSAPTPLVLVLAVTMLFPVAAPAAGSAGPGGDGETNAAIIDEVVVVASKHQRPRREITANVSVFDAADFRFELANSIADVFRYAPGIDYESDRSRFGAESINIRGIAGNRVAILLDGVPVSDQFDVGSFANATRDLVSAGFVDHIEVLHGPASALYGSSAIGGVVAMTSIDPGDFEGQGGRLLTNWRDDDSSLTATAVHAVSSDSLALLAGLSGAEGHEAAASATETNLDQRNFENRSALIKLVAGNEFGNHWRALLYRRQSDVHSDAASILGNGRFRSTTSLLGDDESDTDLASLEYRFAADGRLADTGVIRGWYQASEFVQQTSDERALAARPVIIDRLFSFRQDAAGLEANLQKTFVTGEVGHRLSYGFEARHRETEEYRDGLETGLDDGEQTNVLLGEDFPLRDFPISETDEWGAFLEDTITLGRWSVTGALRADHYEMRPAVDAMYAADYPFAQPVSISEFQLSPRAGLVYQLGPASEVYLQYSRGFRAPPYEDANISLELPLFNIRAVPNPDLRSERSDGFDLGARWRGTTGSAYLSVFRTEYTDFIESKVRLGPDPVSGRILFQSQNIASAVIEGLEAGADVDMAFLGEGVTLQGGLFLARSENLDTGRPLNSVGPPQAVASLNWQAPGGRWRASLRGTFTDDWNARDETGGELFEAPGYAVFDLYVAFRLGTALTLRAGATNLTDKTYWAWTDVRGLAPDDPVIPYLSRPGRSLSVGIEMNW
ncbi:MAG TPA: TonB-dependent receptor [Woeseiaceae bacterium]|nr:TonB-dependent receptor [Woeseiaceae bacterium]